LLINAWATVIACNSKTRHLEKFTTQADIVIMATWSPKLLKVNMVKVWAIVLDVWFTVWEDEQIYGDVDTKLIDLAWWKVTPVPGWIWALTVAMLMKNTLKAYKLQNE
jgi:methylenetetrahydrofolate dehydrogenase (NADP+)/methenyltetrahydrofolate cyclohydrolase